MSYQVIARKWRPQTFEEVTGQEVITHTLRNAIEHDRLHHAYLFSGSRGVGKTTTARLLAKSLNCHRTDGPNLTPCSTNDAEGMCPSCLEISESRSIDVIEIDAASHTGIDDVRATILDSISFNPARDRYKIFIIDEIHQLSKPAFNALLKTLEEPPETVVFVMATTELHKVPDTIRSRCQEFIFRTIPLQKIFDRLRTIADAEKIDVTDDALREIARSGEGSMRDAQSNFDQVISFSDAKITSDDVTGALGFASVEILKKTIAALAERSARAALEVVDELSTRGHDLRNFCRDLLGLFRDMLVCKVAGDTTGLFDFAVLSQDELSAISAPFGEADLIRFFNSMAETEARLKDAAHARYVLEIGLVKLIEMRSVPSVEGLIERLAALDGGAAASPPAIAAAEKKTLNSEPRAAAAPTPAANKPAAEMVPQTRIAVERSQSFEPEGAFGPPQALDEPPDEPPFDTFSPPEADPLPVERRGPVAAVGGPKQPFRSGDMPVRLPPITAAEMEHIDDERLDSAFETKLTRAGDDLAPIGDARTIAATLLGTVTDAHRRGERASNGNSGTAAAPAFDVSLYSDAEADEDNTLPPPLGAEPTEEELLAYASAHPAVKRALRIFRGKIVSVSRKGAINGTGGVRDS